MNQKRIPTVKFPDIKQYNISVLDESLVSLSKSGFLCESQYFIQNIPGSLEDCYARKTVCDILIKAQHNLPDGFKFKIYDAYRPIEVQQYLWDEYRQKIQKENPDMSDEELDFKTSFFVSKPSYNIFQPSLHNTGGSVDLTIITSDGTELDMGTEFDDFSGRAWTNHFEETYEKYEENKEVRDNRRLLYNAMIDAGFTNLPSEWWHYDYGTKFWGYFKKHNALYTGILQQNFLHQ